MKYKLSGISFPLAGISWNRTASAKDKFSYLFVFLESKRVLVNPIEMEKKEWCLASVLEIKTFLVSIMADSIFHKNDITTIQNMIDACNQYLDTVSDLELPAIIYKSVELQGTWADLNFDRAMKVFRHSFRTEIQKIERKYKLSFNKEIPEDY